MTLQDTSLTPVVGCRCGFQIVDNNQIRGFVSSQQREYDAREALRQAQAKARIEETRKRLLEAQESKREAQEAEREEARREANRKRVAAEKRRQQRAAKKEREKVTELPQPSAAQRKQGYTTPVYCSECGALIWRRKCEVKQREHFFCSRVHLSAWRKQNPQGVIRSQARSTG